MVHEKGNHGRLASKKKISPISASLIAAFPFDSEPLSLALCQEASAAVADGLAADHSTNHFH